MLALRRCGPTPVRCCDRCVLAEQLVAAAQTGQVGQVRNILTSSLTGVDASTPNSEGFTALVMAAEEGHVEVAELLIAAGADKGCSANDACPLVRAAGRGHLNMVAELLRTGADVEDREDGCPAIVMAARHGHDEVVSALAGAHADLEAKDATGCTAMMAASATGQSQVVQILLQRGARPGTSATQGHALSLATLGNHLETAALLIKTRDVDVDLGDEKHRAALSFAAERNLVTMGKLLLGARAEVDHADDAGDTPLVWACRCRAEDMVELLLQHKARVNHLDARGRSPVMQAAALAHPGIVTALLEARAEVNLRDGRQWPPLAYAYQAKEDTREMLTDKAAVLKLLLGARADADLVPFAPDE